MAEGDKDTKSKVRQIHKPKDDTNMVKDFARQISAAKQRSDDERMALAGIYKKAEDAGLNGKALKEAIKYTKMDQQKARILLDKMMVYLVRLGFLTQEVKLPYAEPRLDDVEPAA